MHYEVVDAIIEHAKSCQTFHPVSINGILPGFETVIASRQDVTGLSHAGLPNVLSYLQSNDNPRWRFCLECVAWNKGGELHEAAQYDVSDVTGGLKQSAALECNAM